MDFTSRGTGDAVLFLHGIPTSGQLWSGVIRRMFSSFTCVAVDVPGFKDLSQLVSELEELRIRCDIDRWHLVGHDAGCATAVHYARRFPGRVGCMVLMSPSMFPDLKPFFLFEILRWPMVGELMAPGINFIFWKYVMRSAVDWDSRFNDELADFRKPFAGLRGAWRLMSLLRWGNPAEVLALIPSMLRSLDAPTLIFHGTRDPAVPEEFARRAAALLPEAELVLVDAGHFFPLCEPELVAERMASFFESRQALVTHSPSLRTAAHESLHTY